MRKTPGMRCRVVQLKENVSLSAYYTTCRLSIIRNRFPARSIQLNFGKRFANTVWYDFLERGPVVELSSAGWGNFIAAASVCVYIQKS